MKQGNRQGRGIFTYIGCILGAALLCAAFLYASFDISLLGAAEKTSDAVGEFKYLWNDDRQNPVIIPNFKNAENGVAGGADGKKYFHAQYTVAPSDKDIYLRIYTDNRPISISVNRSGELYADSLSSETGFNGVAWIDIVLQPAVHPQTVELCSTVPSVRLYAGGQVQSGIWNDIVEWQYSAFKVLFLLLGIAPLFGLAVSRNKIHPHITGLIVASFFCVLMFVSLHLNNQGLNSDVYANPLLFNLHILAIMLAATAANGFMFKCLKLNDKYAQTVTAAGLVYSALYLFWPYENMRGVMIGIYS